MNDLWPRILSRRSHAVSPWMHLVEREVQFGPNDPPQIYHAVGQADYVAIVARTPQRRIPLVRQYRPALECFTLELPAGIVDGNEDPMETCRRELLEETGLPARTVRSLGTTSPCTGRLSNRIHSFFVDAGEPEHRPESGIELEMVEERELVQLIADGRFVSQLHIGTILLAAMRGLIDPGIRADP